MRTRQEPTAAGFLRRFSAHRALVLGFIVLSLSGCHRSGGGRDADCPAAATAQARPATGASRPVILLTGFEPFGEARPPNPSWDGIAALDGRQWHDYRLVCKRMRVEWGRGAGSCSNGSPNITPSPSFRSAGLAGRVCLGERGFQQPRPVSRQSRRAAAQPGDRRRRSGGLPLGARPGGVFARFPEKDTRSAYRRARAATSARKRSTAWNI